MSTKRVNFRPFEADTDSSPLEPEEKEPMVLNSEEYKIEHLCNPNNDIFSKLEPELPGEAENSSPMRSLTIAPKLSKSMPMLQYKKLHLNKNFLNITESTFPDAYPECHYDIDSHQTQVELICKIPSFVNNDKSLMIAIKELLENIPYNETNVIEIVQKAYTESDPLLLVYNRDILIQLYLDYIDDLEISDLLIQPLTKLLLFTSHFISTKFCVRDVGYLALHASDNVSTQYREFFVELSETLSCDFIDEGLQSILIETLKVYHDKNVLDVRWALMNLEKTQIISSDMNEPSYTFTLMKPQYDMQPIVENTIPDQKKILKIIYESAGKAETVLRSVENHEIVASWVTYFQTTHMLYKQLFLDYSPAKITQAGSLFGKSLSALTKFGPISGKLHPDLPDLVSNIVLNVSIIDEYIAHNRTGFILLTNLMNALSSSITKLHEYHMTIQDPSEAGMCSILFWNLVKIRSYLNHPQITKQKIHSIGPFFILFAQGASSYLASICEVTAFELSNVNASLNTVQLAFIEADSSLHNLSSACIRAERRFKDTPQRAFARQWSTYANNLASCIRSLFSEPSVEKCISQLTDVISILSQLKAKANILAIENEYNTTTEAINHLNSVLHTVR